MANLPICPWCTYAYEDYFEMGHGDYECNRCSGKFSLDIDYSPEYYTEKISPSKPK